MMQDRDTEDLKLQYLYKKCTVVLHSVLPLLSRVELELERELELEHELELVHG